VVVDLRNTIIAVGVTGEALRCKDEGPAVMAQCSDVYGNEGGDWTGCIEDLEEPNNISLDPLFCSPNARDFRLASASPCLPGKSPCGSLIGAYDQGCEDATGCGRGAAAAIEISLTSFPNPFNPVARIAYAVPEDGPVDLAIYDVSGRRVAQLVSREQSSGLYVTEWNAESFSSGVYFCRLQVGGKAASRKLLLLK